MTFPGEPGSPLYVEPLRQSIEEPDVPDFEPEPEHEHEHEEAPA